MKNNKFIKTSILKIIDNLYKLSGKKEIPDIKKICTKTHIDKQTAARLLSAWQDKYCTTNNNNFSYINELTNSLDISFQLALCLS